MASFQPGMSRCAQHTVLQCWGCVCVLLGLWPHGFMGMVACCSGVQLNTQTLSCVLPSSDRGYEHDQVHLQRTCCTA